jgi:hypothetical protein
MRNLLLSILLLCGLALTGCGERTRVNVGAEYAVYIGSTQWMHQRIPPGIYRGDAQLNGYYDPADGSITLSEQLRGLRLLEVWTDELKHAQDHHQVDFWTLLKRYQSPTFQLIHHSDEEAAILAALCAALPPPDPNAKPSR